MAITWDKTPADLTTAENTALDAITKAPIGEDLTFTITPATGKVITGITYQAPGGTAKRLEVNETGSYRIPGDDVQVPGLKITIESGAATFEVGVTAPAATLPIFITVDGEPITVTAGDKNTCTVKNGGTVVITGYDPIELTAAVTAGDAEVEVSDDNLMITISNVKAAFDVTVRAATP